MWPTHDMSCIRISFLHSIIKYDPLYLRSRIDNFNNGFHELLDALDDETFENHRNSLIAEKLDKGPSLTYEIGNHWAQITDKRYFFDMMKVEAEELKTISKNDVIIWYNTYLRSPSPKCRQLAIYVWGCNTNMHKEAQTPGKFNGALSKKLITLRNRPISIRASVEICFGRQHLRSVE